jgi:hypothetical protein
MYRDRRANGSTANNLKRRGGSRQGKEWITCGSYVGRRCEPKYSISLRTSAGKRNTCRRETGRHSAASLETDGNRSCSIRDNIEDSCEENTEAGVRSEAARPYIQLKSISIIRGRRSTRTNHRTSANTKSVNRYGRNNHATRNIHIKRLKPQMIHQENNIETVRWLAAIVVDIHPKLSSTRSGCNLGLGRP